MSNEDWPLKALGLLLLCSPIIAAVMVVILKPYKQGHPKDDESIQIVKPQERCTKEPAQTL